MQLYAVLSAREQALLNELDQLHKTKALTLTEQQDRLRIFQACLGSAVQRAMSTVQSGNTELLVAMSDIVSTIGAMEKQPLVLEPLVGRAVLDFNINLEQLLDLLDNAGMVSDKSTSAATTTAEGAGLERAMPGEEVSFTIIAHDAQGSLRGVGGDMFMVELTENDEVKVGCNVEDKGDGTYAVTYTIPTDSKDTLRLSVLFHQTHIKGSPFVVNNVPVGKVSCYGCGTRTNIMTYYQNNREPSRKDDFRVNGYSAVCNACSRFGSQVGWIRYCGPC